MQKEFRNIGTSTETFSITRDELICELRSDIIPRSFLLPEVFNTILGSNAKETRQHKQHYKGPRTKQTSLPLNHSSHLARSRRRRNSILLSRSKKIYEAINVSQEQLYMETAKETGNEKDADMLEKGITEFYPEQMARKEQLEMLKPDKSTKTATQVKWSRKSIRSKRSTVPEKEKE